MNTQLVVQTFVKNIVSGASKNSPTILTGIAVGGLFTTIFLTIKATSKALVNIEDEKTFRKQEATNGLMPDPLAPVDILRLTWQEYVPAAVMAVVTTGCIVGANTIQSRRYAALMAIYGITEASLKEYQEKTLAEVGPAKEQKIRDNIAEGQLEKHPMNPSEVIITDRGETLCFDKLSGRYFKSDIELIRKAQNTINEVIIRDSYCTLNDFYYELGLDGISLGANPCWSTENMMDIIFSTKLANDFQPCLVMDYRRLPKAW